MRNLKKCDATCPWQKSRIWYTAKHFQKHYYFIDSNKNELIKKLVQTKVIVFVKSETRKLMVFIDLAVCNNINFCLTENICCFWK